MRNNLIKEFVVENRIEVLTSLAEEIDQLAMEWKLSPGLAMNINLVLEEALSNIIFYAFSDDDKHKISITIQLESGMLTIKITDDGIPFNPLLKDKPNISLPAEERPVGGLGIYLISKIMDEMQYNREKDKNLLTLHKKI